MAVFETRMVYFCSPRCKDHHQRADDGERPPPQTTAPEPSRAPSPLPSPEPSKGAAPEPPPQPSPSPATPSQPPSIASPSPPPAKGPIKALEVLAPEADEDERGLTGALVRGELATLALGALLLIAAFIAPALVESALGIQVRLLIGGVTMIALLAMVGLSLSRRSWRAALEEGLVAFSAALVLVAGASSEDRSAVLIAVPGIAALTWLGRWLEASLRTVLVRNQRSLHPDDEAERERLVDVLWGDSPAETTATRGWAEPAGSEPLGQPSEPNRSDLLPQIAALRGEGASPTGRSAMGAAFFIGWLSIPLGLLLLLALLYWATATEPALLLSASFILALSPRGLRRGWIGPLLIAAGRGATKGLLFRDGAALEATARANWVVFDARGTLTYGHPEVSEVVKVGDLDEAELLALAAGVETAAGDNALGDAIVSAAVDGGLSPVNVRLARRTPGLGMSATSPRGDLLVGTRQLILGQGISVAEADEVASEMEARAETVIFVALAGRIQGVIGLRDRLRPDAKDVAQELSRLGTEPVLMTGDSRLTADALGKRLGFEHVRAEVEPDQWIEHVRSMKETGNGVAMVARPPRRQDTLAAADVGLALGRSGLEVEAAGVALDGDDPGMAVQAVALARGALRTVRLNLTAAAVALVILPGLASLLVNILLPTPWIVPMAIALVSSLTPALLSSKVVTIPRSRLKR